MYICYVELCCWQVEIFSVNEGEYGGFKEVIVKISGDGVYGWLKFEFGGYCVQCVLVIELQGWIYIFVCMVVVMLELLEVEMLDINLVDLCIDIFCFFGVGGQYVNIIDLVICIIYLFIGIVVECQDECFQYKNKVKVLLVLGVCICVVEVVKCQQVEVFMCCNLLGSGDCSDCNCIYNFLQGCVIDYCINLMFYCLDEVMEGKFDMLIELIVQEYQVDQLVVLFEQE